jgi:hypothetical protein
LRYFIGAIALSLFQPCFAQPEPSPPPIQAPVQDKNFYFLSLIQRDGDARASLSKVEALAAINRAKRAAAAGDDLGGLKFSEADIAAVSAALTTMAQSDPSLSRLLSGPLARSGMAYPQDGNTAAGVWEESARAINRIISVYGLGEEGFSDKIDAISYDPAGEQARVHQRAALESARAKTAEGSLFFEPSLDAALALLTENKRDEAGRFEPLENGENAAAFKRAAALDWSKYKYSVVLVPGDGPEDPSVRLTPAAQKALAAAAAHIRAGEAPFILVSGGYVHPKQTPYCEAIEMKRWLVREGGIADDAIIVDPHARHTTTNMRNAARLIYRYGLPFGKTALSTTSGEQSAYLESEELRERCLRNFGYVPYGILRRTSLNDLEFRPKIDSLRARPADPLDP